MEKYTIGDQYHLHFVDHILDNVHGHIGLTRVEKELERTAIFKRLQNISQLGLVNRIFPCALHTRYTHSIGVMYVVDQMSQNMGLDDNERQLLRLAGLLHDIGHYPLSHNVEQAYKNYIKISSDPTYDLSSPNSWETRYLVNVPDILKPDYTPESDYKLKLGGSKGPHHEAVGAAIIKSNKEITSYIKKYFVTNQKRLNPFFAENGKDTYSERDIGNIVKCVLDDIAGIVTGNIQKGSKYFEKYTLFVQLMHSELDADNIDYLLRDATFSGTTYGLFDIGVLINALTFCRIIAPNGAPYYILGILPKGVGCVEQFFLNRYLAYTQIVYNKYVSILESMMVHAVMAFLFNPNCGYKYHDILKIATMQHGNKAYLYFTDDYILDFINNFDFSTNICSSLTKKVLTQLKTYLAFPLIDDNSEAVFAGTDYTRMVNEFKQSSYYDPIEQLNASIVLAQTKQKRLSAATIKKAFSYRFECRKITEQVPQEQFKAIQDKYNIGAGREQGCFNYDYDRLANGVPILESREDIQYLEIFRGLKKAPELIVDSSRSAMKDIYKLSFCVLRRYNIA